MLFGIATVAFLAISPAYAAWRAKQPLYGIVPPSVIGATTRVIPMGAVSAGDSVPRTYVAETEATTRRR